MWNPCVYRRSDAFLTTGALGTYAGSTLLGASSYPYDDDGFAIETIGSVSAGGQGDGFTHDGSVAKAIVDKGLERLKGLKSAIPAVQGPLGICIMTADFWGLKSAGGTATAYELLAEVHAPV